ncbi:MAG TPA: hypothetical protein VJ739_05505, partial [Gemmataceae bacterium]|nr:hypothetical protein [Gemmataceae bacterium]
MGSLSLRRLLRPVLSARRPARKAPRRLWVEQLEDRCVPSTLQAISVPGPGQPPSDSAAGPSFLPAVSADGRYVAFESDAPNLVAGQTAGSTEPGFPSDAPNVFLLDRTTGSIALVSHLPGTATVGANSAILGQPLLSRDGRYVVYVAAPNVTDVPAGVTVSGVVIYDRTTGQNTPITLATPSSSPFMLFVPRLDAVSGNGRYIVFDTAATGVVPGEVQGTPGDNLYLYDQTTHTTFLVTHVAGQDNVAEGFNGAPFGGPQASVADDGLVAFLDSDTGGQLVSGATGPVSSNVYLYNPANQTNQLVSATAGTPGQAAGLCGAPVISEDGSTVVFPSQAPNLVSGQTGPFADNVFRYTVPPGAASFGMMTLVSGSGGSATQGGSADSGVIGVSAGLSTPALAVTPDGRFIAFVSQATDLVSGQSGAAGNVFLYDSLAPGLTLLSGVGGSSTVGAGGDASLLPPGSQSIAADPISGADTSLALGVSDDGSLVAFVSQASDLVPGQTGPSGNDNVFLYSRAGGRATLVTGVRGSATAAAAGQSGFPVLSGDGSTLAFHSLAFDLGSGFFDGNGVADVFTYGTATGTTALVSRAAFQQVAPGNSYPVSVSGDGRYTVFTSTAEDLVPNQTTATFSDSQNIFLFDEQAGTNRLVNHVPGLPDTTGDGGIPFTFGQRPLQPLLPVVSADGSTVAFTTTDDNLVPGEPPGGAQVSGAVTFKVYLYAVADGQVRLVNHAAGSDATPNLSALEPAISASGRYVAYVLGFGATAGPSGFGEGAIALYDSMTDTTTMITPLDGMDRGTASDPTISDDGRFIS